MDKKEELSTISDGADRKIAVDLFNAVWELLDKVGRTEDEDYSMVHMAHTSLYHWSRVGGDSKSAYTGEWQISRVYSALGNFESAVFHARRALQICRTNGFGGFELGYAYEALSRAYSLRNMHDETDRYRELAEAEAASVSDPEERELLVADLKTIRAIGR